MRQTVINIINTEDWVLPLLNGNLKKKAKWTSLVTLKQIIGRVFVFRNMIAGMFHTVFFSFFRDCAFSMIYFLLQLECMHFQNSWSVLLAPAVLQAFRPSHPHTFYFTIVRFWGSPDKVKGECWLMWYSRTKTSIPIFNFQSNNRRRPGITCVYSFKNPDMEQRWYIAVWGFSFFSFFFFFFPLQRLPMRADATGFLFVCGFFPLHFDSFVLLCGPVVFVLVFVLDHHWDVSLRLWRQPGTSVNPGWS